MGACDTCVGCGIEVAANGALKVDLQTGGGIVCDLTDPTVNDQISGLYLNVDGASVTTKPDGIVRAQIAQSGMRRSSLLTPGSTMSVPSDSALYPVNALGNLNTIEYDIVNGAPRLSGAGYGNLNLTTPNQFAAIPVGAAGLYEWEFHAHVPTPSANQNPFVLIIRFTVTDPNGSGSYIVDRVGYWGNPFASIGPWPLGDGATITVGLINPTGQVAITVDTFAFVIAKVGS